tara:strand:- start:20 stop:214 length:195 start_codon:yes stop_codon:yes gene_type:complete
MGKVRIAAAIAFVWWILMGLAVGFNGDALLLTSFPIMVVVYVTAKEWIRILSEALQLPRSKWGR